MSDRNNYLLSVERLLASNALLYCKHAGIKFPLEVCSREFKAVVRSDSDVRLLLDGYRAAMIPTILRTDEVPNDAYLSGGFEHGLYRESIMAQMYDDSKRSGALARGKA